MVRGFVEMENGALGGAIKRHRLARGLSQTDLGRRVETDQGTISEFETGARRPGVDMLRRLAGALDVPYNRFAELAGYLDPTADPKEQKAGELPAPLVEAMEEMIRKYPELRAQIAGWRDEPERPARIVDLARVLGIVIRGWVDDLGRPDDGR
jgi:transcriptional regulator with XRE-family HTH domain